MADDLPEFRDWSRVAVLLMRGVVYSEDDRRVECAVVECFDTGKLFRSTRVCDWWSWNPTAWRTCGN